MFLGKMVFFSTNGDRWCIYVSFQGLYHLNFVLHIISWWHTSTRLLLLEGLIETGATKINSY